MNAQYWSLAETVCTAKQYAVLELRERHRFSLRQIALATNTSTSTVRDHLAAAHRRVDAAVQTCVPAGGVEGSVGQSADARQGAIGDPG